jgi:hypothetical protein
MKVLDYINRNPAIFVRETPVQWRVRSGLNEFKVIQSENFFTIIINSRKGYKKVIDINSDDVYTFSIIIDIITLKAI